MLWRFAHLLLARAQGAHDSSARAAALRLALSDDVPLDTMRAVADAWLSEIDKRGLKLRIPSWRGPSLS
jgi:hypothetical protein